MRTSLEPTRRGRARRFAAAAVVIPLTGLTLVGCGPPPWQQPTAGGSGSPSAVKPSVTRPPTPTRTPTPTAQPPEPVQNDLATGSHKSRLTAGNVELSVNYWSTLDLADWTPGASKPLNLSASAKFSDDSEQDIFLSGAQVAIDAVNAQGQAQAVKPIVDESDQEPGYLITAPTSYGQVFTLPAVPPDSRALKLTITYELLVQTAPEAKQYSRQAAVDTLQIALSS